MVGSKAKGLTIELLCQAYLTSLGYNVSIPIGEECKYDLIVDIQGRLMRVQVKACQEEKNGIKFSTRSVTTSGDKNVIHTYSKEEVDYFATFYNEQCYLIPIEECAGRNERMLSFENKQTNAIIPLYIEDFTAEKIIDQILKDEKYIMKEDDFVLYQYDLKGNLINTFSSYKDANLALNKTTGHISQCARGLRKTAYGFQWTLKPKD